MALCIESDPGICSLGFIMSFGGSIPMSNDYDTDYTNDSVENYGTFEAFVKDLKGYEGRSIGDYDVDLYDFSMLMAACVMPGKYTKGQPKTIEYFRKLGFHEIPVPEYGKYKHGLVYFHMTGLELKTALSKY